MTINRTLTALLLALLLCLPLCGVLAEEIVLGEPDGEVGLEEVAVDDDRLFGLEELSGDIDTGSGLEVAGIELNADLSLDGADLPEAVEAPAVANVEDAEDVPIDEAHFPDESFRHRIDDFDTDVDGVLSVEEGAKITELVILDEIADLRGIEYLPWIEYLDFRSNKLTSLDVRALSSLKYLVFSGNQLTSLDVSGLTSLKWLYCGGNQLTSLDVSGLTSLESLYCSENQLKSLDLSRCPKLRFLSCNNNLISSLDFSFCTELCGIECKMNLLKEMEIQALKKLYRLSCVGNEIRNLDLTNNPMLVKTIKKGKREDNYWEYNEYCLLFIDTFTTVTANGKTLYMPPSIGKCIVTDATGETSAKLYKGDTLQLKGTVEKVDPETYTVVWSSSDGKVTTVNRLGKVTGVKKGTATITVTTANGKTASVKVTVK